MRKLSVPVAAQYGERRHHVDDRPYADRLLCDQGRRAAAVVMRYQNWERIGKRDCNPLTDKGTGMMNEVASQGAMPMVTWTP